MSDKINSVDATEYTDDTKSHKPIKTGKHPLKHTNCQSIPSTVMSFVHNQSANNSSSVQSEGKHHHHHHHHHSHGHHQPHVIHRTTSESLRLGSEIINNTEGSLSLSNSTSVSGSSGTSSSGGNTSHLNLSRKPKTSSFQITSVTVGNKLSADNGEDSADDLDESHTDDNSRITDMENETPSFSEDTFSKEDVFFSNSALGTAPVIPTSSQYGLVIVDTDLNNVGGQAGQNLSNVHVSMADAGINIVGPPSSKLGESDQKDMGHRNERFKVVKIESTEPFKRGRWMCMDYLDHSTLQVSDSSAPASAPASSVSATGVATNDSGVIIPESNSEGLIDAAETNPAFNPPLSNVASNATTHSPGQTLQKPLIEQQMQSVNSNISGVVSQSNASVQNAANVSQANVACANYSQSQMHQGFAAQYAQASHIPGQSQPAHFYQNNQQSQPTVSNIHGATLPSNITIQNGVPTNFVQQTAPPPQSIAAVNVAMSTSNNCPDQGAANMVTTMPPSNMPQSSSLSQPVSMAQVLPQTQQLTDCYIAQSSTQGYPTPGMPVTSTIGSMQMDVHHSAHQEANTIAQQPSVGGVLSVAGNTIPQTISPGVDNVQQANQSLPNITSINQEAIQPIIVANEGASAVSTPQQPQQPQTSQPTSVNEDEQGTTTEADNERVSTLALALAKNKRPSYRLYNFSVVPDELILTEDALPQPQDSFSHPRYRSQNLVKTTKSEQVSPNVAGNTQNHVNQRLPQQRTASLKIPLSKNMVTGDYETDTGKLSTSWSGSVGSDDLNQYHSPAPGTSVERNCESSASGTSAVAIDNKIEQAMDLVKSHLMIAVREEVEVLKEKIAELMDRINQLELENTILKANVSQETLSQLSATMQNAATKPAPNPNSNTGPIS